MFRFHSFSQRLPPVAKSAAAAGAGCVFVSVLMQIYATVCSSGTGKDLIEFKSRASGNTLNIRQLPVNVCQ